VDLGIKEAINKYMVKTILEDVLMDKYWCIMSTSTFRIHVGHEHRMYILSSKPLHEVIPQIQDMGFSAEKVMCPY
jgi:hypothetical protein